jgi:hypothetical protein
MGETSPVMGAGFHGKTMKARNSGNSSKNGIWGFLEASRISQKVYKCITE